MKKIVRSLSCVLLALTLILSVAVLPAITAYADEAFEHPVSEAATANDTKYIEELKALGAAHIFSFDTRDFGLPYATTFGDQVVEDAGAYNGKAAKLDSASRVNEANNALNVSMFNLPVCMVDRNSAAEGVGGWYVADLVADGEYHLYKIEDTVLIKKDAYNFMYMFNDWGFQIGGVATKLAEHKNKYFDVYLSMKLTGNVNFTDPSDLPVYYIDRVIVAGACGEYDVEYNTPVEATCTENAGMSGACPICGNIAVQYSIGTRLDHVFTNYVTNEDGTQTAECDFGCGTTDTIDPAATTEPVPETEPVDETTEPAADEATKPTDDETQPTDDQSKDNATGNAGGISPVLMIIFAIVSVALFIASMVVVLRTGKKKIPLILIAIAVALVIAVFALYLTGATTSNNPNNDSSQAGDSSDPSGENNGDSAETRPTTPRPTFPELTDDNSLNLNNMKIVLPAEPTEVEISAAQELVDYVKKITGKELNIAKEGSAEIAAGIYVGDTEFAKANNVTHPSTEYGEGWAIKAVDGNLVLCGDSVRGTLYAVYHLLEDALGVHWWTYTEETVPQADAALVWNEYDDSGAPAFQNRDMHGGPYYSRESLFQVRNRLNGWNANPPAGYGGIENYGSPAYVHSFAHYVPDSMFNEHPEWFSEVDGQRVPQSQLCMTNQELIEYMTSELLRYIAIDIENCENSGTARPRWYSLVPNDWDKFCGCKNCAPVIEQSGLSGYLLKFVNTIAETVAIEYPEVLVDTLAYWQYIEPPLDDTKPADNVIIRFAWNSMDIFHSLSHENNANMLQWAQAWSELTKENQLFYWDYLVTYHSSGVQTFMYKLPDHLQTLLETGFVSYFGEMENPINSDFWDMKMWLIAKLLEDPYQDFDYLVDTFVNGYYGAAGPYIREYLDMAEDRVANDWTHVTFGVGTTDLRCFSVEDIIFANDLFDKAIEAVAGDEELLIRVRLARNCLDRLILERFNYFERTAEEQGIDFQLNELNICDRLVYCIHEQIKLRGWADYTITGGVNDYGWVARYEDLLSRLQANQ